MQTTFPQLLLEHAARRPAAPALREKEYGIWQTLTWADLATLVQRLAGGLAAAGFQRGQHLVVIGDNRPNLYAVMLAAQSLGGIPVPLYRTRRPPSSSSRSTTPKSPSRWPRTRSRSTSCWRSARSARSLHTSGSTTRAACAATTNPGLASLEALAEAGEAFNRAHPRACEGRDRASAP